MAIGEFVQQKEVGTTVQEINKFIKSFEMTQKMMKKMQSNKGRYEEINEQLRQQ